MAAFVLLCAAGLAGLFVSGRQEIVPERTAFATFPTALENGMDAPPRWMLQTEQFLGLTDYILTDYSKPDRQCGQFLRGLLCIATKWGVTSFTRCLHSG